VRSRINLNFDHISNLRILAQAEPEENSDHNTPTSFNDVVKRNAQNGMHEAAQRTKTLTTK
jgi:hypothetical protein